MLVPTGACNLLPVVRRYDTRANMALSIEPSWTAVCMYGIRTTAQSTGLHMLRLYACMCIHRVISEQDFEALRIARVYIRSSLYIVHCQIARIASAMTRFASAYVQYKEEFDERQVSELECGGGVNRRQPAPTGIRL